MRKPVRVSSHRTDQATRRALSLGDRSATPAFAYRHAVARAILGGDHVLVDEYDPTGDNFVGRSFQRREIGEAHDLPRQAA